MRPARAAVALLLLAVLSLVPALAAPWAQPTEEFAADLLVRHDSAGGGTNAVAGFSWWHYATPNIGIGGQLTGLWSPTVDGAMLGPSMVYHFVGFGCDKADVCKGNLELGGAATATTGDLTDQAAAQLATWVGARWKVGTSAAAHLLVQHTRALSPGDAGSNGENVLDSTALLFRFSVGVKSPS